MNLDQLGLTPSQQTELTTHDPNLVTSWLTAVAAARGLRSPAGWFLAGVRSGNMPSVQLGAAEQQAVRRAEARVRNIGYCLLTERELLDELYGRGGPLEHYPNLNREQLLAQWRETHAIPWPVRLQAYAESGSTMRPG